MAIGWHGSGDKDTPKNKSSVQRAVTQAYFDLDEPFRRWLAEINPNTDDKDKKSSEWLDSVRRLLLTQGREMLANAGEQALTGKDNAAGAYQKYVNTINKLTNYNQRKKEE
jgi:CRISPR system Cascade subunit CasA